MIRDTLRQLGQQATMAIFRRLAKRAPYVFQIANTQTLRGMDSAYEDYVKEGYERNPNIYGAIMYKLRSVSLAPLTAYTGESDHPDSLPRNHWLQALAKTPNPYQSAVGFQMLNTLYLNLSGNSYIYIDWRGEQPIALYPLRPDRVQIITKNARAVGYVYLPVGVKELTDGIPIMPDQMIHVKLPNAYDDLEGLGEGMSPMRPLARSGDADNALDHFFYMFTKKGILPTVVLRSSFDLDKAQREKVREEWRETYGGPDSWADVIVISGADMALDTMKPVLSEMDFSNLDKRSESRILMVIGVPGILAGTQYGLERSTYSNYKEANQAFWENVMAFEFRIFADGYNSKLRLGDDVGADIWLDFDTSRVPALRRDVLVLAQAVRHLWAIGVPRNDAFALVGMRAPETEDGDIGYINGRPVEDILNPQPIPAQLLPGGAPEDEDEEQEPDEDDETEIEESEDEGKALVLNAVQRKALEPLRDRIDELATSYEPTFLRTAREQFRQDGRAVMSFIDDETTAARTESRMVNWGLVQSKILTYLATQSFDEWRDVLTPGYLTLSSRVGAFWYDYMGQDFDSDGLDERDWFSNMTFHASEEITRTTGQWVKRVFQVMTPEWSAKDLKDAFDEVFTQWIDGDLSVTESAKAFAWIEEGPYPNYRSQIISREETMRAANESGFYFFLDLRVKKKGWLTMFDDRVRPTHEAAHGQIREVMNLFDLDGCSLMFPKDIALCGNMNEIAGCRCIAVPVIDFIE